jgi:hypothetical protein
MGKVWKFLDAKKRTIVSVVLTLEILARGTSFEGPLQYVEALAKALGWANVAPDVDPGKVAAALGTLIAVGHGVYKARQKAADHAPLG